MQRANFYSIAGLLCLGLALSAAECPNIPEVETRLVDLALNGSTTRVFQARGSNNVYQETKTIDIEEAIDLDSILVEIEDVIADADSVQISASSISYRIVVPQAGRSIANGQLSVERGSGGPVTIATGFSMDASAVTDWITVPLSSGGVNLVNDMLQDVLVAWQKGTSVPNSQLTYAVAGNSLPAGSETNFDWELKLTVSIVAPIEVDVIN